MSPVTSLRMRPRTKRPDSFTLIELLIVMAIIAILTSLVLFAASGIALKAKRSRASTEIQAIGAALEAYKTDNGVFPPSSGLLTSGYQGNDGTGVGLYQTSSQILYLDLTGQTNFADIPAAGKAVYLPTLKRTQVGDNASTGSYLEDPWGYSYGYSTGTTANPPNNGINFFDLWSTGGVTATKLSANSTLINAWIDNWQ